MTISRLLMTPSFVFAASASVLLLSSEIGLAQPMRFDKNLIGDGKTEAQPQTVAHRNFRGGGGFHGGGGRWAGGGGHWHGGGGRWHGGGWHAGGGYWRGGRWYGGGYPYGAGLAAGAIVGTAAAAAAAGAATASDATNYCVSRYRSYDPASGTYLGNDGLRHPCP